MKQFLNVHDVESPELLAQQAIAIKQNRFAFKKIRRK